MTLFGLSALAGAYALQLLSELPGHVPLAFAAAVSIAALLLPRMRLAGAFLAGFTVLAIASHAVVGDRLHAGLAGRAVMIDAIVSDFPRDNGVSLSFLAEPAGRVEMPGRIRVSWFDAPARPAPGETWRLELRLRQPRGFSNPGGFDYEGWLFRQAIGATGYVVNGPGNSRHDDRPVGRVSLIRQRFVSRVRALLPDDDASAVLMAVAVGARQWITREQWQRYATTGTSHLMAISGLHIGLAAGGIFILSWFLFALVHGGGNLRDRAALIAMSGAFFYAQVSGFAVPARRALLMTIVLALAGFLRRQVPAPRLLAICCLVILISDPLAILSPGFKLSFAAVAILFWHFRATRIPPANIAEYRTAAILHGILRLTSTQLALLFGLFPLTALLFGRIPIVAPFVNLLALPIFNFVTVPASLLGLLLDGPLQPGGDLLLRIAHHSVGLLLWFVRLAAELPVAAVHVARPAGLIAVVFFLPALWSMLPRGFPGRKLALLAALAALLYRPQPPPAGCLDMHVLDVGQGLALVMRTRRHALVFDAGPSFRGGNDSGRMVLIPFLRSKGIRSVDLLIVSHADQDHAGGARSLIEEIPTRRILSGEPLDLIEAPADRCRQNESFTWDGVDFEFVHPSDAANWSGNNASCVLGIRAGEHRILLTGDIESPVENLLERAGRLSKSEIVLVPHHGSRTSSSERFVSALSPTFAIVSAGFENRWGFPKDDVVAAWQASGAQVLNTATAGAIGYRACRDTGIRETGMHRPDARKFWH